MELLKNVQTAENLQKLSSELDAVILALSGRNGKPVEQVLATNAPQFGTVLAKHLAVSLEESASMGVQISGHGGQSSEGVSVQLLKKLQQELKKVKVLELTVGVEPPPEMLTKIHSWAYDNVSQNVVLDITVDPGVVGGAVVSFDGKYQDLSLKRKIEELFGGRPK